MTPPVHEHSKRSAVRWLDEVPGHWAVCALNFRYEVDLGKMLDEKRITGEHLGPYLRNADVQWGTINIVDLPVMDFRGEDLKRYALRVGDLLVCEGGEVGRAAVWKGELETCFYQKALHRLRPRNCRTDDPQFLFYSILAAAKGGIFSEGKSTISHLTAEKLRRYPFPFPPISEQISVAAFLDRETTRIDQLIDKKRRFLDLADERWRATLDTVICGSIGFRPEMIVEVRANMSG